MSETRSSEVARERARSFQTRFEGRGMREYQGIPIFAAPGVHEAGLAMLQRWVPSGASVLELGAGGGAMSQRLADAGYAISASDLFEDNFSPRGRIPFRVADLNAAFSGVLAGGLDAIVALELIEHLENPRHFVRECLRLLRPGGVLVLSTPNLANPVSQAQFLRQGQFQWFTDKDYREQGHITPLSPQVLSRCLAEPGFEVLGWGSVGNPFRKVRSLRKFGARLLSHLMSLLSGTPRALRGEVVLGAWRAPE